MTHPARTSFLFAFLVVAAGTAGAAAQPAGGAVQTLPEARVQIVPPRNVPEANATRDELTAILREYPPAVRSVLRLDPSLIDSPAYLAPYPLLAEFLRQHPEVARNPSFFFGSPSTSVPLDRRASDVIPGILAGAAVFITVVTILVIIASLLRQIVEHRRWLRQSRVQTEVHMKVLDRLQSNEDLLAYIQTPAGRRFLESAPMAPDEARPISAPLTRILWSVQAGVVLAFLGLGLWYVQLDVVEDIAPAFYVMGVVAVAVGLGAIASGALAYFLSARLGLLPSPKQPS